MTLLQFSELGKFSILGEIIRNKQTTEESMVKFVVKTKIVLQFMNQMMTG